MSNPKKAKELKDLQSKWYKILEKDGFKDAEQADGNLKIWHSYFYRTRWNAELYGAKEEYYRLAGQLLYVYEFTSTKEKQIWQHHTDGKSIRTIVRLLKEQGHKASRDSVHLVIKQIAKEMMTNVDH